MPNAEVIFVYDHVNFPYGSKTTEELISIVTPILQELATKTDVIVVACNTVSTNLIEPLREAISVPLVAVEPMVKVAAEQTKTGVFAVCATPRTLASVRYQWLKDTFAIGKTVVEPDCADWSRMIEANSINEQKIKQQIDEVCRAGADVVVLGCTHYHWIEGLITKILDGRAVVLQPEKAIIRQLDRIAKEIEPIV